MTTHINTKHDLTMFLLHLMVKCPLFMPVPNCIFHAEQRELSKSEKLNIVKEMDENQMRELLTKCDQCYRREVVK